MIKKYKKILITGGAGFVGSNLCLKFKNEFPNSEIIALDNLMRRGSELNLPRLKEGGIKFIYGDVRNNEDLEFNDIDLLIECSAEPSVMAGVNSSPEYLINTNLVGALNCFELARKNRSDVIFLSTSRIYPVKTINNLFYKETEDRFELLDNQKIKGSSSKGISENFPLNGNRSLYGATKLSAELILQEYIINYNINCIINRCGVITGPWQMGKVDQGVFVLWVAKHYFKKDLSYIGFGGKGKQVRDFIHIDDLFNILIKQIQNINKISGEVFNVGGGRENSFSLRELTKICQKVTGNKIKLISTKETRPGDIRIYLSDTSKLQKECNFKINKAFEKTVEEIFLWIKNNENQLKSILS